MDMIKCNTDGSWNKETGNSGVGWISRDQRGQLLWAGARKVQNMGSPLEAEAEALKWAIDTMYAFQYKQVCFESDSQGLIQMIRGEEPVWLTIQPIIQDIQKRLQQSSGYEVMYQQRGGNMAADRIAKETSSFENNVPRLYSIVPSWLNSFVEVDKPFVR